MPQEKRYSKQAIWSERVAEFKASGLRATQWCAAQGHKVHQLKYWLKKFETPTTPAQTEIRWLTVDLNDLEPALKVKVGVATIEVNTGFDQQLFLEVVKILSAI